ncbi:ATP-binding protein [Microtetraspora fusca]|uniref:ATP-binding protein n=1 Tax=Microtetraspora fusca TaxID=1997 RepID=A0ABW6VK62_MICFU
MTDDTTNTTNRRASAHHAWRAAGIGDPMLWRRCFPGRADQIPAARGLVRLLLEDTPRADDAELVTTELATNALLHSRSGLPDSFFTVELLRCPHAVRITVYDLGGRRTPAMDSAVTPATFAEHGRGLQVVRRLADRVGVSGDSRIGHAVWALLDFDATAVSVRSA